MNAAERSVYPARLDAEFDNPGRWLWLVKLFLIIPHIVVLVFLWAAVMILTIGAGFAILFTRRYPRALFDFNVGVMRWTWRVSYYSFSGFGTDKYPPFSLQPDPDYPADFEVDYPESLSPGLVLVKWWLLAIPHYLVIGIFGGGFHLGGGGGLIALLSIIAMVITAATQVYPQNLFDFVMGMNRWTYRVLSYVFLMRDEYPPFSFEAGGTDPARL